LPSDFLALHYRSYTAFPIGLERKASLRPNVRTCSSVQRIVESIFFGLQWPERETGDTTPIACQDLQKHGGLWGERKTDVPIHIFMKIIFTESEFDLRIVNFS
jgi:hypothetical protein